MIDTKTLRVGDCVQFRSGIYWGSGRVTKVRPDGVDVESGVQQLDGTWNACEVEHFHSDGRGWMGEGTRECGPWELVEFDNSPIFPTRPKEGGQ
jgi:hypothetical protein